MVEVRLPSHGGGASAERIIPTKVDEAGAYMARYIAKNIVWSGLADKCEVAISSPLEKQIQFAVNVEHPLAQGKS